MNNPPSDQGIPLLTEVIGPQSRPAGANPVVAVSPALASPPAAEPMTEAAVAPANQAGNAWSDTELGELESELRDRITRQVLGRIDFVLDHRVRNTLTDVIDSAIDSLAAEIKRGLHDTLTDMVRRAVAQEVSRLQSIKK